MKVIGTLRSMIEDGYRLHAFHDVFGCSHSSELDLVALAMLLGPDFDITGRRQELLGMLTCSKCEMERGRRFAKQGTTTRLGAPPHPGGGKVWDTSGVPDW